MRYVFRKCAYLNIQPADTITMEYEKEREGRKKTKITEKEACECER